MSKEFYDFLIKKGYSDFEIELTHLCISSGIRLPDEVKKDYLEFLLKYNYFPPPV